MHIHYSRAFNYMITCYVFLLASISNSTHCIGSNHRQQRLFNIFLMEKEKHNSTVTWTSNTATLGPDENLKPELSFFKCDELKD